jgi:hypothetical protein
MCHTIYGKYNLLIYMDYSYLWEADIDRICIGRPIKKAQKKQFVNFLSEGRRGVRFCNNTIETKASFCSQNGSLGNATG